MRQLLPAGQVADPAAGQVAGEVGDDALRELYRQPDRPWLRVNFVTSVDGAVTVDGRSAGLGSDADQRVFHLLRQEADALLVGAGTLRVEGYGPVRARNRQGAYLRLVVVSGRLALAPDHPALAGAPLRPAIVTCADAPPDRAAALAAVADVVPVGLGRVDLTAGLRDLRERRLDRILCEGGPQLFGALLAEDLVDEVCLTVSPLAAGPGAGRIVSGDPAPLRHLALRGALEEDGVLLLRYTRPD